MKAKHVFILILIVLSIVFLGLQMMEYEMYAAILRSVLVAFLIILYRRQTRTERSYFFKFLVTFLIADILGLWYWLAMFKPDPVLKSIYENFIYYAGNGLYILSYIFLIIQVLKAMDFKEVITKLPAHLVILVVLDIFGVTIITNVSGDTVNGGFTISEYSIELLYNAVVMTLLTLAVINYIHKVNKKAMNLLLGSIFVVFSEVIQSAYFYVDDDMNALNVLCSLFLVIAFLFLYLQENITEHEDFGTYREHLEA